jgi:RNA polymerase sigma-70 factor (ECF subfamily)
VIFINKLSEIIKRISNGDKNALKELYENMSKDIYTFLFLFCKDKYTAEDALQETFISIFENAGSYKHFSNPKAWIFTIAKNKAVSIIRKNSRTANSDIMNDMTDIIKIEDTILDKIHADMLLSVLSEEDKKIVILYAVYGFKHREIAELMDMPLGTVKWRYSQGIKKMKNAGENFCEPNKQNEVVLYEK